MSTQKSSSNIDWEYICTHCRRGFDASMAHEIVVLNETEAKLTCSWCKHTDTYQSPASEEIERPPAIVTHTLGTDSEGAPVARLFFEGGAWLQYREASDGWVYEEMFTAGGEEAASFKTEFEKADCDAPSEYLSRAMDQYDRYTVRGLGVRKPHVAAVLIEEF